MYALVLLKPRSNRRPSRGLDAAHEAFITELIRRNEILLGGAWSEAVESVEAAYVLRVATADEGRAIAARDPYVSEESFESVVVEWELVGVNPDAIDPEIALRPVDV